MSDEEEEAVTTKRKKLTKKGKSTLVEDSSSEDDDLFGSDNDDEDEKSLTQEEEVVVDATFSKENLESAMKDLKPFVSPNIEFSKFLGSWEDVDKFVSAKEFYILDPSGLVKHVSNVNKPLALEFKCLAMAVARQTCILAKSKDDRAMAQSLFKSKIKADKSMHIGNYVSNTWLIQSLEQINKTETIEDKKNNMHVNILTTGFRFMQDCFVIDNEKKLNVLKEKQNIDWKGTTKSILDIATSKSLTSLEALAKTLTTYLSDFKATSSLPLVAAAKLSRTSSVDSQALLDATRKKREERMRKLRQKAHGAMSLASTPAETTNSSMPSAVAPPPAPPSSYSSSNTGTNNNRSSNNSSGYDKSSFGGTSSSAAASAQSAHISQDASRWNAPSTSPPPPPAPAPPASAAPPSSSWGGSGGGGGHQPDQQQQPYQDNYNTSAHQDQGRDQDPRGQQAPPAADNYNQQQNSWNDQGDAGNSANNSSWSYSAASEQRSYGGQYDDSYRDPGYQHPPQESNKNYDRPVGSGPSDAPANHPQYNDYSSNHQHGGDSYYPGASSGHDNQSGGGGYRRGGGGYDRGPPPQDSYNAGPPPPRQPPYDRYDDNNNNNQYRDRGGGGGRNNHYNNNNKRSRQDAFTDDAGGNRGRGGRSPWMNDNGGPPPSKRHEGARDMGGALAGGGRGRGRTLPAWMTNEGGPGGGDLPPPPSESSLPPPPSQSRGPPRGQPPPSFEEPSGRGPPFEEPPMSGGGRGRGRTLPAWMTQQNDGPGGGP